MLAFADSTRIVATNIEARNNTGPLLSFSDVFNQTIRNLTFTDTYASINWNSGYPLSFVRKRSTSLAYSQWQDQRDQSILIMENIMINVRKVENKSITKFRAILT